MSCHDQKLPLTPVQAGVFPPTDDPGLPGLMRLEPSGRPLRWPDGPGGTGLCARYAAATDAGRKRAHNEDAFAVEPELGLFVVCDGVGGRAAGEVASVLAAQTIWEWVRRKTSTVAAARSSCDAAAIASVGELVRDAIQSASQAIREVAQTDRRLEGMRTTASVVLIAGAFAVIGQVGDSRVYLSRGAGIRQLTEDHTLRNLLVQHGLVKPGAVPGRKSPVTRTLGCDGTVEVDIGALALRAGDRLLLCSDGLHDYLVDDEQSLELFRLDLQDAARAAIRYANACGGEDNITALFVELVAGT